jgi:hypothetical protein
VRGLLVDLESSETADEASDFFDFGDFGVSWKNRGILYPRQSNNERVLGWTHIPRLNIQISGIDEKVCSLTSSTSLRQMAEARCAGDTAIGARGRGERVTALGTIARPSMASAVRGQGRPLPQTSVAMDIPGSGRWFGTTPPWPGGVGNYTTARGQGVSNNARGQGCPWPRRAHRPSSGFA